MTWELADSGKHFITTIINGSDLVPTFSTDYMLPTPIFQNPPSMPNVLASMNKEGNTKASKITGIDSILPLPLIPLDNCLTVVEVVGVLDGGLKITSGELAPGPAIMPLTMRPDLGLCLSFTMACSSSEITADFKSS